MSRNGTETIIIKTRHGQFEMVRTRYRDSGGEEVSLSLQRISSLLLDQAFFWITRLPYSQVCHLLGQLTGQPLLCEDTLWRLGQDRARVLDAEQRRLIEKNSQQPEPEYEAAQALYESQSKEFVVMADGVGVKAQKPTRTRKAASLEGSGVAAAATAACGDAAQTEKRAKRHDTDVLILPRPDGGEQILCEGISGQWSLVDAARSYLRGSWSGQRLSVVALTDGARSIRQDLQALFGSGVTVILDWFHLEKRVYEQLAMAASSRREREEWEREILHLLWQGRVDEASAYVSRLKVRNEKAREALLGYLEKHAHEIIDYGRRQMAGKVIGSGRMEKCVDQVVAQRQKRKGMSWTQWGSRALAMIKVAELNARPLCA